MNQNIFDYRFDYHVHIGQFQNVYYNPYKIVDILLNCGTIGAYVSSTTSCVNWSNQQEKEIIVKHIKAEIEELLLYSEEKNFDAKPLCWVIPQRYYDGESIDKVYSECKYYGFKIHPRAHNWDLNDNKIIMLLSDICRIAENQNVPVMIHTGICEFEKPSKFKYLFETFPNVRFILAHCRNVSEILHLFNIYENLYGDVSFSKPNNLQKLLNSNYRKRLLFGTDFPITSYHQNMKNYNEIKLCKNYKKILYAWNVYEKFSMKGIKK